VTPRDPRPPALVVMAAGMGSRYGGLKQIDPIGPGGETFIDYSVYDAILAGFRRIVFVIQESFEGAFRERMEPILAGRAEARYVCQRLTDLPGGVPPRTDRTKPWGTGQAVLACRAAVDGGFGVINADDFYGRDAFEMLRRFLAEDERRDPREYAVVGYRLENTLTDHGTVSRGVCTIDRDGYLTDIVERKEVKRQRGAAVAREPDGSEIHLPLDAIVSMNMWGFSTSLFDELERRFVEFLRDPGRDRERSEFLLPEVVGALVRSGRCRVRVLPTEGRWFGVTYREDRPIGVERIAELIRAGVYPAHLWSGEDDDHRSIDEETRA